jgi:hypothetical protein
MKKKNFFFYFMINELNNYFSFYFLKFIDFEKFIKKNYLFKIDFKPCRKKFLFYKKKDRVNHNLF